MYPWISRILDLWLQFCEKKCGLYMDVYGNAASLRRGVRFHSFSLFFMECIFMQRALWKATFRKQMKEMWDLFVLSSRFSLKEKIKVKFAKSHFLWSWDITIELCCIFKNLFSARSRCLSVIWGRSTIQATIPLTKPGNWSILSLAHELFHHSEIISLEYFNIYHLGRIDSAVGRIDSRADRPQFHKKSASWILLYWHNWKLSKFPNLAKVKCKLETTTINI